MVWRWRLVVAALDFIAEDMWSSRTKRGKKNARQTVNVANLQTNISQNFQRMKRNQVQIADLETRRDALSAQLEELPEYSKDTYRIRYERDQLNADLKRIREEPKVFAEQMKPLVDGVKDIKSIKRRRKVIVHRHTRMAPIQQQQDAVLNGLLQKDKALPVLVAPNVCNICYQPMRLQGAAAMYVCESADCANYGIVTFCDDQMDVVFEYDNRMNHSAGYNRSELFRTRLQQYAADAPDIPRRVMNKIRQELANVHILNTYIVQHTPITDILRKHDLQPYTRMVGRLTRELKGEPPLKIPQDLIQRLVERFEEQERVQQDPGDKKAINFQSQLRQLLLMEGADDLANLLKGHKSIDVVRKELDRMRRTYAMTAKVSDRDWSMSY